MPNSCRPHWRPAIVGLAVGIARAQSELDRHSIQLQREIDEDPELADLGPARDVVPDAAGGARADDEHHPRGGHLNPGCPASSARSEASSILAQNRLQAIRLAPVNAFYKNQFDFDVNASSKLKLTFVPVPPPVGDSIAPATMSRDDVVAAGEAGPQERG